MYVVTVVFVVMSSFYKYVQPREFEDINTSLSSLSVSPGDSQSVVDGENPTVFREPTTATSWLTTESLRDSSEIEYLVNWNGKFI